MKAFTVFLLCSLLAAASYSRGMKIDVAEPLKNELNLVLKATNEMHSAFYGKDEALIAAKVQSTLQSLSRAQERSYLARQQQTHISKMLLAAKNFLEMTQMQNGEKRKKSLKKAFEQLVNLAKVYRLDNYRIFYCPKDKSVWIQKSREPKNPIHPERYGSCGGLVGRT